MRALIADDEPSAREVLRSMLPGQGIEVIGEAATGSEVVRLFRERRPDVAFVDVQMPGLTAVEVAELLDDTSLAVVFLTAQADYAVAAFQRYAVDYLLKPFDDERLALAVSRVRRHLASIPDEPLQELRSAPREWLFLTRGDRLVVRRISEVDRFEADRRIVRVHVGGDVLTMPGPLPRIEADLDPNHFARISRTVIVNLASVAELEPASTSEFLVVLRDGAQITTTRTYRDRLVRSMRRPRPAQANS